MFSVILRNITSRELSDPSSYFIKTRCLLFVADISLVCKIIGDYCTIHMKIEFLVRVTYKS